MENTLKKIKEARDVSIYQKLLQTLADYTSRVPCTGIDNLLDVAVEQGKKIMPKDKKAIEILDYVLSAGSVPRSIHRLLNLRFSDLPTTCKPMMRVNRRHKVAHWSRDSKISDRVKDLVDWENGGKPGRWTDIDGENVDLIPIKKEDK